MRHWGQEEHALEFTWTDESQEYMGCDEGDDASELGDDDDNGFAPGLFEGADIYRPSALF